MSEVLWEEKFFWGNIGTKKGVEVHWPKWPTCCLCWMCDNDWPWGGSWHLSNYFHLVTTYTSTHIPHRLHIHTHSRTHAYNHTQTCPTTFILFQLLRTYPSVCISILIPMLSPILIAHIHKYPSALFSCLTARARGGDWHVHLFNGCILCNISSHPTKQWTNSPWQLGLHKGVRQIQHFDK